MHLRDQLFENAAAVFVIFELIEAGTGRGEQNRVAGLNVPRSDVQSLLQGSGIFEGDGIAEISGDFFGRFADKQREARAFVQQLAERSVGAAFIAAAENDHQRSGKSFDGFDRGVDVGRFGIVVILHAGKFGDEFEAMFDAAKTFHAGGDGGRDGAGEVGCGTGGQNIFDIVLAAKLDVRERGRAPLPSLRGGK